MHADDAPLAVLGATGFTGPLVCEHARRLGLTVRLVGRRAQALAAVAERGEDVRIADARDPESLAAAFAGAFAVASCAGPFLEVGDAPVAAAIEAGAHYVDTSGEQEFARLVYARHDAAARKAGVAVLTSFGFDYVPGDLAARLAAVDVEEPIDEIVVAYSVRGFASSAGTRRTIGHVMTQEQVAWENELVPSRFGATTRRVRFPFGERVVVEWGGTEPLTVPRHTRVRRVRSYVRAPRAAARAAALARLAAPLIQASARLGRGPSERRRAKARFAVVAEARVGARGRRATVVGRDVYGLTALLVATAARALKDGEARGTGALAPAEAFDARALADRLAPLLEIHSVLPL